MLAAAAARPSPTKPTRVYLADPAATHPPRSPRMLVIGRLGEVGEDHAIPASCDTVFRFHGSAGAEPLVERDDFCASALTGTGAEQGDGLDAHAGLGVRGAGT